MKNITVSVEEEVYRGARTFAARHDRSVSGLVRDYLRALAAGQASLLFPDWEQGERKKREKLVKLLSQCKLELDGKPSRRKTYEGGRFSRF